MRNGSRRDDAADGWNRGRAESAQGRGYQWNEPAQPGWGEPRRSRQSGARQATGRAPGGHGYADQAPGRGGSRRRSASPRTSNPSASSRRARAGTGHWAQFRAKSMLAQLGYLFVCISAVLAVVAGVGAYTVYYHFEGNITSVKVGGLSGRTIYGSLNVLVLGSQERKGQHGFFGYEANPGTTNSDNLLLVHLDPTHTHATVLSIPRDLFVYEPACKERSYVGTGVWPAQSYPPGAIIDGALNIGGPTCAVQTVEALTGIKLDHVIVFDFNSFRTMVDAIGGVTVCVPPGPGYHDGYSHLNLDPGLHKLSYNQALAYVRTRHGVGSGVDAGGDLPRIQLQQAFISSVSQQIEHQGLLSNISGLYKVANIATKALTVDQNLKSVTNLLHLAESLVHLKSKNINLITIPTQTDTYPGLSAHLMAAQPMDDLLYQMVRTGRIWHGGLPTEAAAKVKVEVENATGQSGLAGRTATSLRKLGFDVTGVGDAPATSSTTVNFAGEEQSEAAYTLSKALKSFPAGQNTLAEPASQIGASGTITLILGTDFAGVNPASAATRPKSGNASKKAKASNSSPGTAAGPSSGPGAVQSRNAGASICTGLPPAYTPGAQGPP
jgi:LCP family protein required for cell wall assembly